MKRDNGDSSPGFETERKVSQERIQRAKFVVHRDAQRLEYARDRILVSSGMTNDGSQSGKRLDINLKSAFLPALQLGA